MKKKFLILIFVSFFNHLHSEPNISTLYFKLIQAIANEDFKGIKFIVSSYCGVKAINYYEQEYGWPLEFAISFYKKNLQANANNNNQFQIICYLIQNGAYAQGLCQTALWQNYKIFLNNINKLNYQFLENDPLMKLLITIPVIENLHFVPTQIKSLLNTYKDNPEFALYGIEVTFKNFTHRRFYLSGILENFVESNKEDQSEIKELIVNLLKRKTKYRIIITD